MAREIGIDTLLSLLKSNHGTDDRPASLTIVLSSGAKRGQVRLLPSVRYGAPMKSGPVLSVGLRQSTAPHSHNDRGTIPMTDLAQRNRYITPLISHIIGYNGYKVRH